MIIKIKQIILEATKWKEFSGQLSKKSLKRIKKSGIMKPNNILADGINVGTSNILDKLQNRPNISTKMNFENFLKTGGGGFDNETNTILLPKQLSPSMKLFSNTDSIFQNSGESKLSNALTKRHEAYEAKEYDKILKDAKTPTIVDKGNFYIKRNPLAQIVSGKDYLQVGNHWSGRVLTNEAKDLNNLAYTKPTQRFIKYRKTENSILKDNIGIDLNTVNGKNISKINKKISNYENDPSFQAYYVKDNR